MAKRAIEKVDKNYRTRAGAKVLKKLEALEEDQPGALERLMRDAERSTPPKKLASGKAIYSGSWRSFEADFAAEWWRDQKKPWICNECEEEIDKDGKRDEAPSIDHLKPWATIKTQIDTLIVCCRGVHWEVALTEDVREALQDKSNLVPAHQGCNSSKNGPKDTDSIAPQQRGNCPGEDFCEETKAS